MCYLLWAIRIPGLENPAQRPAKQHILADAPADELWPQMPRIASRLCAAQHGYHKDLKQNLQVQAGGKEDSHIDCSATASAPYRSAHAICQPTVYVIDSMNAGRWAYEAVELACACACQGSFMQPQKASNESASRR